MEKQPRQPNAQLRRPAFACCQPNATYDRFSGEGPPLLRACQQGSHLAVYLMLMQPSERRTIDLNETDLIGHTPLETAISLGHTDIAKMLIEHGADIEHSRRYDGCTPLHSAVIHERFEIMDTILSWRDSYGSINQAADNGFTPLHIACSNSNEDIVSLLLAKGASVESCDSRGWTPLFLAAWRGQAGTIKELIKYGANVNVADMYGQTPLSVAVERGNIQAMLVLLSNGGLDGSCVSIDDTSTRLGIVDCLIKALNSPCSELMIVDHTLSASTQESREWTSSMRSLFRKPNERRRSSFS